MAAQRNWNQWFDVAGKTRVTRFDSTNSITGGAIRLAIQAASNAGLGQVTAAVPGGPYTEPGSAQFSSVLDTLALTYLDTGGFLFNFYMPAPSSGLFLADSITFDGAAAIALNAVIVAGVVNPNTGLAAATLQAGVRQGSSVS